MPLGCILATLGCDDPEKTPPRDVSGAWSILSRPHDATGRGLPHRGRAQLLVGAGLLRLGTPQNRWSRGCPGAMSHVPTPSHASRARFRDSAQTGARGN